MAGINEAKFCIFKKKKNKFPNKDSHHVTLKKVLMGTQPI